jgi:RNA polymerase sigma-70 factor (ECF subfamily)
MDINARLDAVLKALYLLFNEGYYSSHSLENIREDLCFEAMRLAHLLNENPLMNLPKVRALLALMCFHVSRFGARSNEEGAMILLEDQDRQKWDQHLIKIGTELLEKASEGNLLSEYHVEASIAAVHAHADSFDQTDWKKILFLYDLLLELKSGPMVELNRAIAIGYAIHPKEGLNALIQIKEMKQNHLFYSAIANFENLCGNIGSAITNYETARQLAPTEKEKDFLKMKLTKLTSQSALA